MPTPVEKYIEHLDSIFDVTPQFFKNESLDPHFPGVTSIVYRNIPEEGYITGFTYGLSVVNHAAYEHGRPELCISVKSERIEWGQVAGYVANSLRGDCPFRYGDSINFKEQISEESEMDAFFMFAPSLLDPEYYLHIDIGADYCVDITGLYPMYSEEMDVLQEIGLEEFWHHANFDLYDINRKRITKNEPS